MADQGDVEQGSPGRESSDEDTDGVSVNEARRWSPQDVGRMKMMCAADWTRNLLTTV